MSTEKQFIGRVSQIQTTYGPLTKVGISQEDFNKHVKDGWVNFMIKTSKEGKVYLQVDDWKPDPSKKKASIEGGHELPESKLSAGDLPF